MVVSGLMKGLGYKKSVACWWMAGAAPGGFLKFLETSHI